MSSYIAHTVKCPLVILSHHEKKKKTETTKRWTQKTFGCRRSKATVEDGEKSKTCNVITIHSTEWSQNDLWL